MKKLFCLIFAALLVLGLAGCGKVKDLAENLAENAGKEEKEDNNGSGNSSGKLKEGQWPESVYGPLGIDAPKTNGKIVYTELIDEGSYQYGVYYDGVTREKFVAWTDALFQKGFRAHDRDKERIQESYDYDTMIYLPEEKQAYRMRLSFEFDSPMTFEWYDEDNKNFDIHWEKDEDGYEYGYIQYNLSISLNPMDTTQSFEGELSQFGMKAEDFKDIPNIRAVSLGKGDFSDAATFRFYADHVTTEEEHEFIRKKLIDKFAEGGWKFYHAFNTEQELSADELKDQGIGSYYVAKDDQLYLLMVDPDSEYGEFGGGYGIYIQNAKR